MSCHVAPLARHQPSSGRSGRCAASSAKACVAGSLMPPARDTWPIHTAPSAVARSSAPSRLPSSSPGLPRNRIFRPGVVDPAGLAEQRVLQAREAVGRMDPPQHRGGIVAQPVEAAVLLAHQGLRAAASAGPGLRPHRHEAATAKALHRQQHGLHRRPRHLVAVEAGLARQPASRIPPRPTPVRRPSRPRPAARSRPRSRSCNSIAQSSADGPRSPTMPGCTMRHTWRDQMLSGMARRR